MRSLTKLCESRCNCAHIEIEQRTVEVELDSPETWWWWRTVESLSLVVLSWVTWKFQSLFCSEVVSTSFHPAASVHFAVQGSPVRTAVRQSPWVPWQLQRMAVRFLWELCTGITQALAALMHWVKYDEKAGKRMEVVVVGNALERMCIMGTVMERQWTTCNNLQQPATGRGLFSQMDPSIKVHSDVVHGPGRCYAFKSWQTCKAPLNISVKHQIAFFLWQCFLRFSCVFWSLSSTIWPSCATGLWLDASAMAKGCIRLPQSHRTSLESPGCEGSGFGLLV